LPRRRRDSADDGGALDRWLTPSAAGHTDQVEIAEVHDSWTPERSDELPLDAAVALVRAVGVVDPVLLRPRDEGGYEVVAGHRTVAAARAAGLERVPAVVRQMDDAQALFALALDGSATGMITAAGAAELRGRLSAAGVDDEAAVAELLAAAPVVPEAVPTGIAVHVAAGADGAEVNGNTATHAPEPNGATEGPGRASEEPAPASPSRVTMDAPPAAEEPSRWIPLPAGAPRLARLSSAFADAPRMLRVLATDAFTGTVELVGKDGREDVLAFVEGRLVAVSVERRGRRSALPLRLPSPDSGPVVEMTVRPHAAPVVIALALALRAPARLTGLHASFLHLPGLLDVLARERADAACVVSAPGGSGVIMLSRGEPVAAYARRQGEGPGEAAETTDVAAVVDLLAGGDGDVDVHAGPPPAPLDLEQVIANAAPSAKKQHSSKHEG
jgi:hypothetical protein